MKKYAKRGIICAILAAVFYALNSPLSKLMLGKIGPTMMAAFLYLGAGFGMALYRMSGRGQGMLADEQKLTVKELPYTLGMVLLDIAAPIALMAGLKRTSPENVALLNNFEIVATSLIALAIFRERISGKLWLGIGLVTASSMILSVEDVRSISLDAGSLFVLLACLCWGFENNCTRRLSEKNPVEIVIVKGICSGAGSLVIALIAGESIPAIADIVLALCLGFVAYGLSIVFYIFAQRELGAAKTSAYYAIAPFVGVALSLVIFREMPSASFFVALLVMALGTWMVTVADNG